MRRAIQCIVDPFLEVHWDETGTIIDKTTSLQLLQLIRKLMSLKLFSLNYNPILFYPSVCLSSMQNELTRNGHSVLASLRSFDIVKSEITQLS